MLHLFLSLDFETESKIIMKDGLFVITTSLIKNMPEVR
jgi:hypothetical protein